MLIQRHVPRSAPPRCKCGCEELHCSLGIWWICVQWWQSKKCNKKKYITTIKKYINCLHPTLRSDYRDRHKHGRFWQVLGTNATHFTNVIHLICGPNFPFSAYFVWYMCIIHWTLMTTGRCISTHNNNFCHICESSRQRDQTWTESWHWTFSLFVWMEPRNVTGNKSAHY